MTVLTLTNCPPKLTGDLIKWMLEIDTGVYVGNLNTRVREEIWDRVCKNIGNGRAIMVFSSNNEQKMRFYTYNSDREIVDFDGLYLVKKSLPKGKKENSQHNKINPEDKKGVKDKKILLDEFPKSYVILDLETTGLKSDECEIIEIGLLKIENGMCTDEFQTLVKPQNHIPTMITELTGITNDMVDNQGIDVVQGLKQCFEFIGDNTVLAFNSRFEKSFLKSTCQNHNIVYPDINIYDARHIIKLKIPELNSYKLILIAEHLGISKDQKHRALDDCKLLYQVVCKLNENACI